MFVEGLAEADPPVERRAVDAPTYTPAVYSAFGRAEGLALARGLAAPEPEDLLVALIWRGRLASSCPHRLGVDRTAVLAALAARGVHVPPGEPEPLDLRPRKRVDVPYNHLTRIVSTHPSLLPEGSPFGFNVHHEPHRAWILVGEEVDAEPLVADVVAGR